MRIRSSLNHRDGETPEPHATGWRADVAIVVMLLALTGVLLAKDWSVGGFPYGDSAAHVLDGVLILDWIRAGPEAWFQPMQFAQEQYAHYPALGIGRHYPPGFAVVEAIFFAAFGISAPTARLCVLTFGLLAAAGCYGFVRSFADRPAAWLSTALLVTMPAFTEWGRQVMLEIPTLCVLIWTAVAFVRYAQRPSGRRLALVLAGAVAAILFKQTAVFLVAAITLTIGAGSYLQKFPGGHTWACVAATVAIGAGTFLSLDGHAALLWRGDPSFPSRLGWASLTFYVRSMPELVGIPALIVAPAAFFAWPRAGRLAGVFIAGWLFGCYGLLVGADYKDPRYFVPVVFPIAVLAGIAFGRLTHFFPTSIRFVVAGGAMGCLGMSAWVRPIEHRPDFETVVQEHRDRIQQHAVLISGVREGDFIFAVRRHLPWRSAVVVRASKLLYTCNGRADLDFRGNVSCAEDLQQLMRDCAFRHVFIEREDKTGVPQEQWLREYIAHSGDYRRIASHTFTMGAQAGHRNTTLEVYELVAPHVRVVDYLNLWIPRSQMNIRLDLRRWS